MSAYEELLERTRALLFEARRNAADEFTDRAYAKTLLTSILRTLETVTPGMLQSAYNQMVPNHDAYAAWQSMLHASALEPPK